MKHFILRLILFLCLIPFSYNVKASDLTVGVSSGYPPYYFESKGKFTGICIDLVNAVAHEIGIKVHYEAYPWKRLLHNAKTGKIDAIMPLFRTQEREKYLYFEGLDLIHETNNLFISAQSPTSYQGSFEDLSQYKIGVIIDYSYGEKFDNFAFPEKIVTRNEQHLISMFLHNRYDIGIGNRYVIHYYANEAGVAENIKFLDPPITQEMLYLGFTKSRPAITLAEKFAEALGRIKKRAEYQNIINRYGIIP